MREHLLSRWFDPDRYSGVWIEEGVSATFAMWNFSGQMVGYQKYEPGAPRLHNNGEHTRYHTWFGENKVGVWGLESVDWRGGDLFLVEGVFDSCRLSWHGLQSIAVLSNDPKHLRNWISVLPHKLIAVCDGDSAGKKLAKYGNEVIYLPEKEDVGLLSDEQFNLIFGKFLR
jgi:hypothetical protein